MPGRRDAQCPQGGRRDGDGDREGVAELVGPENEGKFPHFFPPHRHGCLDGLEETKLMAILELGYYLTLPTDVRALPPVRQGEHAPLPLTRRV